MSSFAPINPKLLDVFPSDHDGYPDSLAAEDTFDAIWDVCGAASREFPEEWWIEPSDWDDAARDNDKYGTWPNNYCDRFTNQNPTHECTCHSLRTVAEIAWNAQRGISYPDGPKKNFRYEESANGSVWLSALSIYSEANPRIRGGANVRQVMEIACRRGFLPDKIQPRDYGFKHSLVGTQGKGNSNQSSGDWVALKDFPDGWQETGKLLMPEEVILARSWEQAVCCVLRGRGYGVGRNGHAIPWTRWMAGEQAMEYIDSYDVKRYDSLRTVKGAYSGGFCIVSMKQPNDWLNPAGVAA